MGKKKAKKAKKVKKAAPPEPVLHIIGLEAENVKRLTAVNIAPDAKPLVVISGPNGAGKSAVLDSIEYALGGTRTHPPRPVREGANKARIVLDLGDLLVRRTITAAGGGSVIVENKDGAVFKSPQALLDRLTGERAFDPLAFLALSPAQQKAALQELVGLDLSDLEDRRRKSLDAAHEEWLQKNRASENAKVMTTYPDAPEGEIAVADLFAELEAAQARQIQNDAVRQQHADSRIHLENLCVKFDRCHHDIQALSVQLQAANEASSNVSRAINAQNLAVKTAAQKVDALEDPDLAAIHDRVAEADVTNQRVRANKARDELLAAAKLHGQQRAKHLQHVAKIEKERACRLAVAEFPVPGLAFTEGGVTFKELPFEQAARSEQIRVSVAMGLAHNPQLRVMLVREGNDLDPEHVVLLAELAAEHDAQVWLERVTPDQACSVIIVDGHVEGQAVCGVCGSVIETEDRGVTMCEACMVANSPEAQGANVCPRCDGRGELGAGAIHCPDCNGTGALGEADGELADPGGHQRPEPEALQGGVCRVCGCTNDAACPGGCAWTDETETLCTACAVECAICERMIARQDCRALPTPMGGEGSPERFACPICGAIVQTINRAPVQDD